MQTIIITFIIGLVSGAAACGYICGRIFGRVGRLSRPTRERSRVVRVSERSVNRDRDIENEVAKVEQGQRTRHSRASELARAGRKAKKELENGNGNNSADSNS